MKVMSLFSGIGGFDLAFERQGIIVDSVCEIDKNAQNILQRHFPKAKLYDDVRKVGRKTHEPNSIDLICGGFPCQDLSVAGKRAGLAGERSGLWFEFHRVIDELKPRIAVIENVAGLLSSNRGRDFAVVLQGLGKSGYRYAYRVFDAQYFGVAQRRRRVFIVASLGNGSCAEILFEREGLSGDIEQGKEKEQEVAKSVTTGVGHRNNGTEDTFVIPTLSTSLGHHGWSIGDQDFNTLQLVSFSAKDDGRGVSEGSTPTIQAQNTGIAIADNKILGVRRLTPMECERLQGFPDGWTEGQSDSVRYHQLGNAVAVPVAEWIVRRIAGLDKKTGRL